MRNRITLIFFIINLLNILVCGLNIRDEIEKDGKNHVQVDDKNSETGQYFRRLENLESKFVQFLLQDKGFERIGTMIIVNNGHVQDNKIWYNISPCKIFKMIFNHDFGAIAEVLESGLGATNKTNVITICSPENVLVRMKLLEDSMKDLERRMRHLVENQTQISDSSISKLGNSTLETFVFKDCSEVIPKKSGVYKIKPEKSKNPFDVYCDMVTDGGGWTVFQNRFDGNVDFYRGWKEYKNGFGNIDGEYWLGLEKLHELTTSQNNELYIRLEDFDKVEKDARYSSFVIDSENEGYRLKSLGVFSGSAGDSMRFHEGHKFTTFDKKQDTHSANCAVLHLGAWWYHACHDSNLNGKYFKGTDSADNNAKGMRWHAFRGHSLKSAKMMVRPKKSN